MYRTDIDDPDKNNDIINYNFEMVPTYSFLPDEDSDGESNTDIKDSLFRYQFLQVFMIENDVYNPSLITQTLAKLFEKFKNNPDIIDIIRAHPYYVANTDDYIVEPDIIRDPRNNSIVDVHTVPHNIDTPLNQNETIHNNKSNAETIFCLMYSYHTFDMFHRCLVEIVNDEKDDYPRRGETPMSRIDKTLAKSPNKKVGRVSADTMKDMFERLRHV